MSLAHVGPQTQGPLNEDSRRPRPKANLQCWHILHYAISSPALRTRLAAESGSVTWLDLVGPGWTGLVSMVLTSPERNHPSGGARRRHAAVTQAMLLLLLLLLL
ncbi:unnamed protein product [Merluccius merluccius]